MIMVQANKVYHQRLGCNIKLKSIIYSLILVRFFTRQNQHYLIIKKPQFTLCTWVIVIISVGSLVILVITLYE